MTADPDLVRLLKRLKLGQLVPTLAERLTLARAQQLDYVAFLTLLLADEVQRRDHQALERHLVQAGFEDRVTLDRFDWTSPVQLDRRQLQQVFTLEFLARKEHVVFVGPVGVGKSMLAQCLGSASVRAGHSVLFIRADALLAELGQARADRSYDKVFRRYLAPDLVILDDFGLRRLTAQQSKYPVVGSCRGTDVLRHVELTASAGLPHHLGADHLAFGGQPGFPEGPRCT